MSKNRNTGRSTRLVDKYIQEFFTKELGTSIKVIDHIDSDQTNNALMQKLVSRLVSEHGHKINYAINGVDHTITRLKDR